MLESFSGNNFEYQKLTPEEQEKRGILGRLIGVIADSIKPTRNGRKYSAELWNKVFQNPIMQEKIQNRVCFGEACHPIDGREDVDPEKVAICLAEVPKMNDKGQLIGVFDVLNTPCGKILKTMLDYGANIGVSSRGNGDLFTDYDGQEAVDPDTYDCICWDAVFVPAVKEARLKLVTESLNNKKSLKESLNALIEEADDDAKKAMQETIDNMGLTEDGEYEEQPLESPTLNKQDLLQQEDEVDTEQQPVENGLVADGDTFEQTAEEPEVQEIPSSTYKVNYKVPDNDHEFYFICNDCVDEEDAIQHAYDSLNDNIDIVNVEQIDEIHVNDYEESLTEEFDFSQLGEDDKYRFLDRMKSDCEYVLKNGLGKGGFKHLWAGNPTDQIKCMKYLYNQLEEKPEWLTMDDIDKYEKDLKSLDEGFDDVLPMEGFDCYSYYDVNFRGLEDSMSTNDFDAVVEWVWDKMSNGNCIKVFNRKTGEEQRIGEVNLEEIEEPNEYVRDLLKNVEKSDLEDAKLSSDNITLNGDSVSDIQEVDEGVTASNAGVNVMSTLQETLKQKHELENKIISLQEKLSVCYAKEAKQEDDLNSLRKSVRKLSVEAKKADALGDRVSSLTEQLNEAQRKIQMSDEKLSRINEKVGAEREQKQSLKEEATNRTVQLKALTEEYNAFKSEHEKQVATLNESVQDLKKDLEQTRQNYSQKLEKSTKLVEKYKKVASAAANRYIESQAVRLGVSANEIKHKLPESYTFDDIDSVCESLQSYKLSMNRLPFRTSGLNENVKIGVTKQKEVVVPDYNDADEVDEMLKSLAGI